MSMTLERGQARSPHALPQLRAEIVNSLIGGLGLRSSFKGKCCVCSRDHLHTFPEVGP